MDEDDKTVAAYVAALRASEALGDQVVFHREASASPARFGRPRKAWPEGLAGLAADAGIKRLYRHQADGLTVAAAGENLVLATPTASGKTLVYNLPVMQKALADSSARALYLFPLKALAQDQLKTFTALSANLSGAGPTAAIYDGDTPPYQRKKSAKPAQRAVFEPRDAAPGVVALPRLLEGVLRQPTNCRGG